MPSVATEQLARALVLLGAALAATTASAQEVRLLVQRSPLAGFRYHEAPSLFDTLVPGTALELVREPENAFDPLAVRVEWQGRKLGYLPRAQNAALAWAMDQGMPVAARVSALREHANPRRRVEFEVYVE